jgi:hypothetical protein
VSAVVVILLMFCAVIVMVKRVDNYRERHAMRGPRFSSTAPGRIPHSSLQSFPFGPATLWRRVQSMCDGFGAKPFKFRPLDKDDAVPTVRIEREMGPLPSISAFGSVFPHGGAVFLRNIIHRTL